MTPTRRARLEELLTIEATQRLTPAEAAELDTLLKSFPDEDPDAFELAAAAVHLAMSYPLEEIPASLAEQLHLNAVVLTPTAPIRAPARTPAKRERGGRPTWVAWSGWVVAAGLAGVLIWTQLTKPPVGSTPETPPELTLEQKRDRLLKDGPANPARFADTKGNASATVVWSDRKQEGYLEVRGLPVNDPTKEKYQLWIVDESRKGEKPISAGLFNVSAAGTTWVPVNAAIPIGDAAVFAITKEQPTGVWVTEKDMLLVLTPKAG